jgi:hypothetical protein
MMHTSGFERHGQPRAPIAPECSQTTPEGSRLRTELTDQRDRVIAETAPPNSNAIAHLAVKSEIVLIADGPTPELRSKLILEVVGDRGQHVR